MSVGIIGLASSFNHPELYVQNPLDALSEVINEVDNQTDIVVLLFDSKEADVTQLHTFGYPIDLVIRSKAKIQSGDGGNKSIPIYSCGDRGKYVYQFELSSSFGFPMDVIGFLWISYGFPYGDPMDFLWISPGF